MTTITAYAIPASPTPFEKLLFAASGALASLALRRAQRRASGEYRAMLRAEKVHAEQRRDAMARAQLGIMP